jgi:hypothetical protein
MLHHSPLYNKRVPPLSPLVNFTNILRMTFSYKSFACSFLVLYFQFVLFWFANICAKAALKRLVKLTPYLSFTSLRICRVLPLVIHNASFQVHEQRKFEEWNLEFR